MRKLLFVIIFIFIFITSVCFAKIELGFSTGSYFPISKEISIYKPIVPIFYVSYSFLNNDLITSRLLLGFTKTEFEDKIEYQLEIPIVNITLPYYQTVKYSIFIFSQYFSILINLKEYIPINLYLGTGFNNIYKRINIKILDKEYNSISCGYHFIIGFKYPIYGGMYFNLETKYSHFFKFLSRDFDISGVDINCGLLFKFGK